MRVNRVFIIGGTGMLGRPVVRRLIEEGFAVKCLVRDLARAKTLLPSACNLVYGDVRDGAGMTQALNGCEAAYINLSEPMASKPPSWDVEVEGTRAAIAACKASGVQRLLRISAMGVNDAASEWWGAKSKADADRALMDSDLAWTIFRPTWFMESICTFKLAGPFMVCPDLPHSPLRWIAGDDFARQVAGALRGEASVCRTYQPQGSAALTIKDALKRFQAAWTNQRLRIIPAPMQLMRLGKPFSGKAHYLVSLMDMTRDHFARIDREAIPTDLPAATMTIEDYAQYVARTGDWPRK